MKLFWLLWSSGKYGRLGKGQGFDSGSFQSLSVRCQYALVNKILMAAYRGKIPQRDSSSSSLKRLSLCNALPTQMSFRQMICLSILGPSWLSWWLLYRIKITSLNFRR